ncbi:MAG: AI-2E family transporter [Parafannyhessea sp.]|uniref:AI-2E family transporter n=1 Tax=Parafannyhessea sp. TaxID=2847324 RepID=UPI003F056CCB
MSRFGLDDSKYSTISRYVIATGIVLAIVANVGVHLPEIAQGVGVAGAWVLAILNPLVAGGLVACLLWPLVTRFDRLLARVGPLSGADGARHALAVVAVVLLAAGTVAAVVAVLLAFVTNSIRTISPGNLNELVDYVGDSMSAAYDGVVRLATSAGASKADVDEVIGAVEGVFTSGGSLGQTVSSSVDAVRTFASDTVFATIFCVYFLIDGSNLAAYWDRTLRALMGERPYGHLRTFALDARHAFAGYMRGQVIDALLMGLAVSVTLEVLGVPYALLIGIATGLGNLIPYVGPIVAYASTLLACLVTGDLGKFVWAAIALAVIQFVDGQIVNPKILADSVEVHPIVVIVALIVGGKVGGLAGMFVAVPCAAMVKIYFERYVAWRAARREAAVTEGSDAEE